MSLCCADHPEESFGWISWFWLKCYYACSDSWTVYLDCGGYICQNASDYRFKGGSFDLFVEEKKRQFWFLKSRARHSVSCCYYYYCCCYWYNYDYPQKSLWIHTRGHALVPSLLPRLAEEVMKGLLGPCSFRGCGQTWGKHIGRALACFLSLVSLLLILWGAQWHVSKKDATRNKVCYELFYLGLIIGTEDRIIYSQEAEGRKRGVEMRWRAGEN